MWNLKCGTNDPIYSTETEHGEQTCGCRRGVGREWEFGINIHNLLHLEWSNNKVLLYSTGKYIQSPGIDHDEK